MELCSLKAIPSPLLASTSSPSHLLPKSSICLREIPITRTPSLLSRSFYLSNLRPRATASEETPGGPSWYVDEKQDEKRDGAISLGDVTTTDRNTFNENCSSVETKDESSLDKQVRPFDSTDTKPFNETLASEETKDEPPVDEQMQPFDPTDKKASNETLSEETKHESPVVEQVQAFDSTEKKAFIEALVSEETKDKSPVDEQVQPFDIVDNLNIKFGTDDTTSILIYGGGAIVALWLTSTVVSAIDSIPLCPKLLEVVGLAYTLWFTSRYLLFKQNRDELAAKIEELKEQVLGSDEDQ